MKKFTTSPIRAGFKTVEEAIDDASFSVSRRNWQREMYVYKLVKIVRRSPPPIEVEDVE